jgi:predicted TPR repeat methyltransferase
MLTAKRRYAHGADYLRAALNAAGLALIECVEATLRSEGGSAVAGLIFTARR